MSRDEESATVDQVLEAVRADDLQRRLRTISGLTMRIEEVEYNNDEGCYLLDFILRREDGPGRSRLNQRAEDFGLNPSDRFGEHTAALFHPQSNVLLMEYNHRGVKIGRVQEYLSDYRGVAADSFDIAFAVDPQFRASLEAHERVPRSLIVALTPTELTRQDRGAGHSVATARNIHQRTNSNHVLLEITAQGTHGERLNNIVLEELRALWRLATLRPRAIKKLHYKGKTHPDKADDTLNLLEQRLEKTSASLPTTEGRRIPYRSRFDALLAQWQEWRALFAANETT